MPTHHPHRLEHLRNGNADRLKVGKQKTMSGIEFVLIVFLTCVALFYGWKGFWWVCHKSAEQELEIQKAFYDQAKVPPKQPQVKQEQKPSFIPNTKLKPLDSLSRNGGLKRGS